MNFFFVISSIWPLYSHIYVQKQTPRNNKLSVATGSLQSSNIQDR